MSKTICRNVVPGIDDKIAEILGIHERVASRARADYDEAHPDNPLDTSNLEVAARILLNYMHKEKAQKESEEFAKKVANPIADYSKLKEEYPNTKERFNRIAMIANVFSSCVDSLQSKYPSVDREDLIKGFINGSGEYIGGPANIFKEVHKRLYSYMKEHAEDGDQESVDKYMKVFKNIGALSIYSTFIIRDVEGVNIGHNLSFASSVDPTDFNESENLVNFTVEESKKEHWQELSDSISPFGSTSKLVRRVIGRLTEDPNNEDFIDDLGFPIRMNPVKGHQSLMEILRGIKNENEMVNRMLEYIDTYPFIKDILNEFKKDPILRTQFFVDFSKCFQTYTILEKKENSKFKFSNLNILTKRAALQRYLAALKSKTLDTSKAVFNYFPSGAEFDIESLNQLAKIIEDFLGTTNNEESKAKSFLQAKIEEKQYNDRIFDKANATAFYKNVLPALGITLNNAEYNSLVRDRKKMRQLNKALIDMPIMLRRGKTVSSRSFEELLNKSYGDTEAFLKEKIGAVFKVTESISSSKKVLSRIRYQGNNYYSDVKSSYLGRFSDLISVLSNNKRVDSVKKWLDDTYLRPNGKENKVLVSNGVIRNRWLRDLYASSVYNDKSFVNKFTYTKFLGDKNQKFEDFGSKKQAYTQILAYFAESKDYAWYPVFILGDSGVSKYIRAPRYSEEDIINGIFDLYMQEKEFQTELKELKKGLENEGKSTGSLKWLSEDKFGVLQFLQEPKYLSIIDNNNLEESVKKAAITYLEDSYKEFINSLRKNKVLDRDSKGNYIYLSNAVTRYRLNDEKNTVLDGMAAIDKNLRDYFFNHQFAMMQQMNIMTINPLFFNDGSSLDLQKRNKQLHASGDRLSTQAVNPFSSSKEKFSDRPYQVVRYFQDIKTNTEETDPDFMEVIKDIYGENSDVYNAYKNKTSLTDGQGYRTLESYRAVMGMAGKWNKKTELAYQKLQEIRKEIRDNGKVTEKQRKAIEDLMLTFQPLKPFSYTLEKVSLGDNTFMVPVQLKYAEIVVIPELCKEGKLKAMMEWAEQKDANGIPNADLMLATTGCKVGGFGEAHIENTKDKNSTLEALNNSFAHTLDYEDMILQTNVPDHLHESHLFATQSRKIVMSGLRETDDQGNTIYYNDYIEGEEEFNLGNGMVPANAYNINRLYVGVIAANILENLDQFKNSISNPEKVKKILTQMTINNTRESKDNLNGYELTPEEMFLVPLFEGGIEHDTAAFLLSLFKKQVNKQKILGGSAVQASAFGINGYTEDNNLKFEYAKDENGKLNIVCAQCEMPFDLSYTDAEGNIIKLKFEDWCNADGTLKQGEKDSLLEEQFPGITKFIAYRIPTEAKYSMLNLRVVRFTQKVDGGGTIKVPAQGTTIAGFDFDIDKLYFMKREFKVSSKMSKKTLIQAEKDFLNENKELKRELYQLKEETEAVDKLLSGIIGDYKKSKSLLDYKEGAREQFESWLANNINKYISFETYDYSKTPWDKNNTRVARNNLLVNIIWHRLSDPNSLKERVTPGGFDNIKRAAKLMRELTGTDNINYVYSDPWTMVLYNQQNQVADKLIGIFANQNANHNISLLLKDFYLENAIAFGNHPRGLNNLKNPNALSKELLAASVDAVKDPQLIFLNLNTITASSAGLLCRLGYSFEEIGVLFNQPIIKYFCDYCADKNFTDFDTAIENVKTYWKIEKLDITESSSSLSMDVLKEQIKAHTAYPNIEEDANFKYTQARVLQLFAEIYKDAQDVSSFITNTKFTASNAVKSTFGGMIEQQEKVEKYIENLNNSRSKKNVRLNIKVSDFLDNPIDNMMDISDANNYFRKVIENPFGYEQAMYDANVEALKALGKYYPYLNSNYSRVRRFMSKLSPLGLNEETINDIHDYILRYAVSNVEHGNPFNPETTFKIQNQDVDAKTYYTQYVPYKIMKLLRDNPELRSLAIFDSMIPEVDEKTGILSIKLGDNGALEPTQKEAIRESWESLLDEPGLREIARDLYMYSYYKSGFGFGVIGFNHLASVAIKESIMVGDIPYLEFMRDILSDTNASLSSIDTAAFARYFIANNKDNNRLVYTPKDKQLALLKVKSQPKGIVEDDFEIEDNETGFEFLRLKTSKNWADYRPAININGVLFICNNPTRPDGTFNRSLGGKITYQRVQEDNVNKVLFEEFLEEQLPDKPKEDGEEEGEDSSTSAPELVSIYKNDNLIIQANTADLDLLIDAMAELDLMELGISEKITPETRGATRAAYVNMVEEAKVELGSKDAVVENIVNYLKEESKRLGVICKVTGKKGC
jgi:hypothetical protein